MGSDIQKAIRDQIVTLIQSVHNPGNVYDRYKYSSNWQTFLDQFAWQDLDSGYKIIKGWWVSLPTMTENIPGRSFDEHWHNYTWPIRGIMSLSDRGDSEDAFDTMLWAVVEVLHDQGTLGQGPGVRADSHYVVDGSTEVEAPIVEIRQFGSTLCHYCELRMTVGVAHPVVFIP